jgi:F0F1-type ATP synthase epsilon subunit
LKNFKSGYSYYWAFDTPIKDINIDLVEQNYNEAREKLETANTEKEKVEANSIFKRAKVRYQMVKQEGLPG